MTKRDKSSLLNLIQIIILAATMNSPPDAFLRLPGYMKKPY